MPNAQPRFQERTFLLLTDDTGPTASIKEALASPLRQAQRLIARLVENDFDSLRADLDSIKGFAAGITRAEKLASTYAVARYHTLMFPFQQQFHSSYRANQGKVLEGLIKILLRTQPDFDVPQSVKKDMRPHLSRAFGVPDAKIPRNDVDVLGVNRQTGDIIAIQLRSRDDTGGTTAKSSLVEMLRGLLRLKKTPSVKVMYLVGVWEQRDSQQRQSTINKFYQSLRDQTKLTEADFEPIGTGLAIAPNVTLKMAYGLEEILDSLFAWTGSGSVTGKAFFARFIKQVSEWDDLWVAYALATLELETMTLRGVSNMALLEQKLQALELDLDVSSYRTLHKSIDQAVPVLVAQWGEDTLPVHSPADQMLYVRDLLFLRAIYLHTHRDKKKASLNPQRALRETSLTYQPRLFHPSVQRQPTSQFEPELISFRELVPDITETTYLTHPLYYYPAKFIPQVVRYCLREYTTEGQWVIDPFAGSATVGLEAALCGRNAALLDLNLMLEHIVPLKMTVRQTDLDKVLLGKHLHAMQSSSLTFRPDWSNLEYWYDPAVLATLSRYWGWQKQMTAGPYAWMVEAALLKASKEFSFAEHKAPKLFKSKTKLADMAARLQSNWQTQLDETIADTAFDIFKRVQQLVVALAERESQVLAYGGVDSAKLPLTHLPDMDCLISSPPYLQAQEYIRTSKLELFWLGHAEADIKRISKLEIPYRPADQIFETPTLQQVRARLKRADLHQMLDSYFCYTIQALANAVTRLRVGGTACIFVGNPKIDGIEVETWRILGEYFSEHGFVIKRVLEDRIKNRQLFGRRKNKNPDGMKSEFLLVLSKL